jgi:hypothetical protein
MNCELVVHFAEGGYHAAAGLSVCVKCQMRVPVNLRARFELQVSKSKVEAKIFVP